MLKKTGINEYKINQISTASSEKLVIMLYEGAIRFLNIAMEKNTGPENYDIVNTNIIRTQDIIAELMLSLDQKKGGKLASNLMSLYIYFKKRLLEANVKKDNKIIQEIINHLENLKSSWKQIIEKNEKIKEP